MRVMSLLPPGAEEVRGLPALPLDAWVRPAFDLCLHEIAVEVVLRQQTHLGTWACALVRGRLGQQLRAAWCLTGAATCVACASQPACDFARLFDGKGVHPFWLQGVPAEARLPVGRRFRALLYLAPPAHGTSSLMEEVLLRALGMVLPAADLGPPRRRTLPLGALLPALPEGPVQLSTETPLDLRGDQVLGQAQCPQAPWLALLVRVGIRRIDALLRAFGPSPGPLPRALLPDLSGLQVHGRFVCWYGSRYSHRQRRRLPLQGLLGTVVLTGQPLGELLPLLRVLTVTSVGKATALGLGTLRLSAAS